jgi:hypothetical protein
MHKHEFLMIIMIQSILQKLLRPTFQQWLFRLQPRLTRDGKKVIFDSLNPAPRLVPLKPQNNDN